MSVKTRRFLCIGITVFIFLVLAAAYPFLPDQIPVHWGPQGEPDYGSRNCVWMYGGMAVLFNILFEAAPRIDPRYRHYMKFIREYNLFCVFMNFYILAFIAASLIQAFYPGSFDMVRFICIMVGITLVLTGNILPKFKLNFFSGFRTPWALSDEENWRKTQRLGGKLLFLSGIIWLASAVLIPDPGILFAAGITSVLTASIVPFIMSYVWWRRSEHGN